MPGATGAPSRACLAADNSPMCTNESALAALASSSLSRLRDLNDRDADLAETSWLTRRSCNLSPRSNCLSLSCNCSLGTYRPRRWRNKRRRGISMNNFHALLTKTGSCASLPLIMCCKAKRPPQEQRHRPHHGSATFKHLLQIDKVQTGQPFIQPVVQRLPPTRTGPLEPFQQHPPQASLLQTLYQWIRCHSQTHVDLPWCLTLETSTSNEVWVLLQHGHDHLPIGSISVKAPNRFEDGIDQLTNLEEWWGHQWGH